MTMIGSNANKNKIKLKKRLQIGERQYIMVKRESSSFYKELDESWVTDQPLSHQQLRC